MCSEKRGTMTAWWRWSGSLKEEGNQDDHLEKDNRKGTQSGGWFSWAEVRGTAQDRANWRTRVAALCAL